jgi:hypothetical protein
VQADGNDDSAFAQSWWQLDKLDSRTGGGNVNDAALAPAVVTITFDDVLTAPVDWLSWMCSPLSCHQPPPTTSSPYELSASRAVCLASDHDAAFDLDNEVSRERSWSAHLPGQFSVRPEYSDAASAVSSAVLRSTAR